ncbi:MAG: hypothetical protein GY696_35610 [Gammaproteobacteria bacterium]|nr:hypothetical protein [Gammaproteobacteria bacterium]
MCHVFVGHCLEGYAVSETLGTAWAEATEAEPPTSWIARQETGEPEPPEEPESAEELVALEIEHD